MKKSLTSSEMSELTAGMFLPKESMLEVGKAGKELFIGLPKETSNQEKRISLVPESVELLVNNGHRIIVEAGAGNNANFTDTDYSEAGAQIVYTPEDVYQADIVMKVAPPSQKELDYTKNKQTLFSILQITMQEKNYVPRMSRNKITALAFEYIRDEMGMMPIIKAMGEIVGRTSILIAAELLSNATNGKGELLGGVTGIHPSEVVILGAGTVAESAARTAIGLGASVKVFDNSLSKLRRLKNNLGREIYTSTIVPSILSKALCEADVAVGAIFGSSGVSPCLVAEEMVSQMRFGSVIIDVSIDQGGCFETSEITSHAEPTFNKYGVIHYCVPNIASRVARTASYALSNVFTPILLKIGEHGGLEEMLWNDKPVRQGVYLYNGTVTNKTVGDVANLPYRDINLLMASRF